MSNVWFTSDLHIGHSKIAGLRAGDRVFPAVVGAVEDWHDRMLAKGWDEVVGKDDVVWVLGDISSGTNDGQRKALAWLKERPGRKRLVPGNHDGVHGLQRDGHKWEPEYREVFERIVMAAKLRIPLPEGHLSATLSHFPYDGDHTDPDRHTTWRLRDEGLPAIHGHTHSTERVSHSQRGSLQVHVGVDANWFAPVPMSYVTNLIATVHEWEGKL
ncbi:phosphoesterase [Mycobacterium phage Rey]|uniref:Metallophosphoesterase n=1 Tax=Mycobacterium phage Rey TaxID=1034115 RepID=G1D5I4_9CAUD|nr:phosphoesterase [Mycobacterium phage Rey]AEK10032.1 metallophosphoesterase [Mycobacterium phage Rey]